MKTLWKTIAFVRRVSRYSIYNHNIYTGREPRVANIILQVILAKDLVVSLYFYGPMASVERLCHDYPSHSF
jgi:hypothetical protein